MTDYNTPKLAEWQRENFNTLSRAAKNGGLALMSAKIKATGEIVAIICAVNWDGDFAELVPIAHLPNENPYEFYEPVQEVTPE